jgi:hypothetical protein
LVRDRLLGHKWNGKRTILYCLLKDGSTLSIRDEIFVIVNIDQVLRTVYL